MYQIDLTLQAGAVYNASVDQPSPKIGRRWGLSFLKGAFSVALALLFLLVLQSIASQINPPANPFMTEPYPDTSTKELCEQAGGRWVERASYNPELSPAVKDSAGPICQGPLRLERDREAKTETNRQTMLVVFAIGGTLAVAASLLLPAAQPIAPGLMLGAVFAFFVTGTELWILSPGWGRLLTILGVFVIIVSIGLYAFRDREQKT